MCLRECDGGGGGWQRAEKCARWRSDPRVAGGWPLPRCTLRGEESILCSACDLCAYKTVAFIRGRDLYARPVTVLCSLCACARILCRRGCVLRSCTAACTSLGLFLAAILRCTWLSQLGCSPPKLGRDRTQSLSFQARCANPFGLLTARRTPPASSLIHSFQTLRPRKKERKIYAALRGHSVNEDHRSLRPTHNAGQPHQPRSARRLLVSPARPLAAPVVRDDVASPPALLLVELRGRTHTHRRTQPLHARVTHTCTRTCKASRVPAVALYGRSAVRP